MKIFLIAFCLMFTGCMKGCDDNPPAPPTVDPVPEKEKETPPVPEKEAVQGQTESVNVTAPTTPEKEK